MIRSISRRLVRQVLLISVVVACLAAAYQLHAAYRSGQDDLDAFLGRIGATHVPALSASVWQLDEGQIRHQLAGIARYPDVSRVSIDSDLPFAVAPVVGPVRSGWSIWSAPTEVREYPLLAPDEDGIQPGVRAQSVGTLRVEVSLSGLLGRVGNMALGILLTELVRSAALALVLLVGVRQLVLRPLQQVSRYAGELSLDHLDQPLHLERPRHDGPDEIDVLAGAINDMRASLLEQVETRQAMERQAQQLAVEKEAAELASAAKGEFLANVSHEIRTPMNAIIGMADLTLHSGLPEPQRGYIQRVRSSADLLMGILNDILDFSKIEAGKLDIDTVDFDLDDVVRSVSEIVGVRAREQSLILSSEVASDVPSRLRGDPLRLQQVLLNLMGNAVKFTARGRVALRVDTVASVGASGESGQGLRLRFMVQDTGLGMTADQMSRLFQPFTQADASTSRRFGGTGLGLAISRQLVERMGGRIDVASEPGHGSTFWVELPFGVVAEAPTSMPTATVTRLMSLPGAADHPELAGLRVLLVEDNEVNQELAVALLERVGIQVTLAGDGQQALACLKAGEFDCVLMDCQMPEMDGYTATRLMREQPEWSRVPVIAMTANAMSGEREKVLEAGMNDHVPKPVPVGELYRKIAVWTGRHQAGGAQGVAAVR